MARYYRRRYTRVVRPKKKWASNMRAIKMGATGINVPYVSGIQVLCANSAETYTSGTAVSAVTPTPTVIKTGNFKVQCDAHVATSAAAYIRLMIYIMYIPEGVFTPSSSGQESLRMDEDYKALSSIVDKHPEWILAWRQFATDYIDGNTNLDRVTFSSRLKRNLNSGDQICAIVLASREGTSGNPITGFVVNGTCQFWTCAN